MGKKTKPKKTYVPYASEDEFNAAHYPIAEIQNYPYISEDEYHTYFAPYEDFNVYDKNPHYAVLRKEDKQTGTVSVENLLTGYNVTTTEDRIFTLSEWKAMQTNLHTLEDIFAIYPDGMITKKIIKGGVTGLVINLNLLPLGSEVAHLENPKSTKLPLTISVFRKEENEFVQYSQTMLTRDPHPKRNTIANDEIENPIRYTYPKIAMSLSDSEILEYESGNVLDEPTSFWCILNVPAFVDLNSSLSLGITSDGKFDVPSEDDIINVQDYRLLLDASESLGQIMDAIRDCKIPIRYRIGLNNRRVQ